MAGKSCGAVDATRIFGVAAALMILASVRGAGAACSLGAVAVLPLQTTPGGHFVVPADVNGHEARFILDTGSYTVELTRTSAALLGVRLNETDATGYGVGGTRHIYRGTIAHFRFGNMNADHLMVGGSEGLDVFNNAANDGLFGMSLMAAYDVDLDIVGRHAIIFQAEGHCRTPTVALAQPLYDVPLVDVDYNREADVDILVDGQTVRALLDSGAPHTVMFRRTAQRFGIDLSGFTASGHKTGYGLGPRRVATFTHVFDVVKIGNLEFHNMPITIIDQASLGMDRVHTGSLLEDPSDGRGGGAGLLLGADFMTKVHCWISHSSQRLIMQYPPQPSVLPH